MKPKLKKKESIMFELVGIINDVSQDKIGGPFLDHEREEVVATFDNEKDALAYIKKARLKQRKYNTYVSDDVFRKKSLLAMCEYAYVRKYCPVYIEHNPKI